MKSIATKFLVSAGLLATLFSGFLVHRSWSAMRRNIEELTTRQATLALEFDLAIRDYVAGTIRPEMERRVAPGEFVPEVMSTSCVARNIFDGVRERLPDYLLKFSSDDPRNPANRAGPEEKTILQYFRAHPEATSWTGNVRIDGRQYFACFTPRRLSRSCLACHGSPEDAPKSLVARYGPDAGFHRSVDEVVAMDTVAIPTDRVNAALVSEAKTQLGLIALGVLGLCCGVALLFHFLVARRLKAIAGHFREAAEAEEGRPLQPIAVHGRDEIAQMAAGFNALAQRLAAVHASLEQRVAERTAALESEVAERNRVAQALQTSEVRFRALFDHMQSGVSVFRVEDGGERFVFEALNQAGAKHARTTVEQVVGKSLVDAFPDSTHMGLLAALRRVWKTGESEELPAALYRDDRFSAWFENYIYRLPSGEIVAVFEDVTERKETEEALRREKALSDAMIDSLPGVFYLFGAQGNCLRWNRNLERVTGCSPEELATLTPTDIIAAEDQQRAASAAKEALSKGEASCEAALRNKDGDSTPYFLTGARVLVEGEPCLLGMGIDIAERKQMETALRENEARLRVLLESASDLIFSYDKNLVVQSVSAAAERMLGRKPDELVGRPLFEIIQPVPPYDQIAAANAMRVFSGEQVGATYYEYSMPDGKLRCAEVTGAPLVRDGQVVATVCVARDMSERKEAEELNRRRKAAEAASRAKSAFLAKMSHEIRTPMNGIIGMLDLLDNTAIDARQKHYVRIAKSSSDTLLSLINDILDLSKIEAGKLELERVAFDLRSLVEETAELFYHQAAQKRLELTCRIGTDVPQSVLGDPERTRQVLANLVNNAIKFTDRGNVVVHVRLEERQEASAGPQRVAFDVEDTGIGIPADRKDRLFESFSQVDSSVTRKHGGTGLGLAICRQLVELMGGEISVESELARGSTFSFVLPLEAASEPPKPTRRPPQNLRGMRILAVDDNETNLEILRELMTGWGFDVLTLASPEAVMNSLRQAAGCGKPFSLAIVDQHMPGIDGLELAAEIKRSPETRGTAVLMFTSIDSIPDRRQTDDLGLAGWICKPVRQSQLLDAIVNAVGAPEAGGSRAEQPGREAGAGSEATSANTGCRILVAEDNDINQIVTGEILSAAGYRYDVVPNGRLAVEAVRREVYDLVLMDCEMPEMDGLTATREIRKLESEGGVTDRQGGRLPIIALTAHAVQGDRQRCLAAGMDGYVSKPIDTRALLAEIERLALCRRAQAAGETPTVRTNSSEGDATVPLDIADLHERCLGNTLVVRRVLEAFSERVRTGARAIQQAILDEDDESAVRLSHSLKGAAANVAAGSVSSIAAELECLSRNNQVAGCREKLPQLDREVERCLEFIEEALSELAANGPAAIDHCPPKDY